MIIGFAGKAGSGKSTACKLLLQLGYTEINFADPLKAMVAKLTNLPLSFMYDQEEKARPRDLQITRQQFQALLNENDIYHLTFAEDVYNFRNLRMLLQSVGDLFKLHDINYWVRRTIPLLDPNKKYCMGDIRYQNEVDAITEAGGSVVMIRSPRTNNNDTHSSEQLLLTTEYALSNIDMDIFKRDILAIEGLINRGKKQRQESR